MKIEDLIQTPESVRERRRRNFVKAQYFCLGMAAASIAGYSNAWWKSAETAVVFVVLFVILGVFKVRSCRGRRPHEFFLPSENVKKRTTFIDQEEY